MLASIILPCLQLCLAQHQAELPFVHIQMLIWGLSAPNVILPHQTKKLIGVETTAELHPLLLKAKQAIIGTDDQAKT